MKDILSTEYGILNIKNKKQTVYIKPIIFFKSSTNHFEKLS